MLTDTDVSGQNKYCQKATTMTDLCSNSFYTAGVRMVAAVCSWHEHHELAANEMGRLLPRREKMSISARAPSMAKTSTLLTSPATLRPLAKTSPSWFWEADRVRRLTLKVKDATPNTRWNESPGRHLLVSEIKLAR